MNFSNGSIKFTMTSIHENDKTDREARQSPEPRRSGRTGRHSINVALVTAPHMLTRQKTHENEDKAKGNVRNPKSSFQSLERQHPRQKQTGPE